MADGDVLLDDDGNVILDDDGNVMLSDGAGDDCCCTPVCDGCPATAEVTLSAITNCFTGCHNDTMETVGSFAGGTFTLNSIAPGTGQLCRWQYRAAYTDMQVKFRDFPVGCTGTVFCETSHLNIELVCDSTYTWSVSVYLDGVGVAGLNLYGTASPGITGTPDLTVCGVSGSGSNGYVAGDCDAGGGFGNCAAGGGFHGYGGTASFTTAAA